MRGKERGRDKRGKERKLRGREGERPIEMWTLIGVSWDKSICVIVWCQQHHGIQREVGVVPLFLFSNTTQSGVFIGTIRV